MKREEDWNLKYKHLGINLYSYFLLFFLLNSSFSNVVFIKSLYPPVAEPIANIMINPRPEKMITIFSTTPNPIITENV
ncbi:Predicted protein [Prochlorococcus marinus subsp. marinus str. CCMP1375]|uniref:Uncharacterized protein n=1 Tax=Prochlorococcus marinus (strain SARG / CCMP1375 / SS120) TaxID=167539 RepID=Q7VBA8_PROMA|nr:Predicted protein [Prochlorococcus marinus subsp. marinus str. CCMP1375]